MSNKILVITNEASDLLRTIQSSIKTVTVIKPEKITSTQVSSYNAIALLGGTSDTPMLLDPAARLLIEKEIASGKRVFAEYVASIGHVYSEQPSLTRFYRLVYCDDELNLEGLQPGDILDDQCGMRIKPHDITCVHTPPILQFAMYHAHDRVDNYKSIIEKINERALWFDTPSNLLICSFRLCSYIQARFAPQQRIVSVIQFILNWLYEPDAKMELAPPTFVYKMVDYDKQGDFTEQITETVELAMDWLKQPELLLHDGKAGYLEGYGTDVFSDGSQKLNRIKRADCIGEVSMAFFLESKLSGCNKNEVISDQLENYIFDHFINREPGDLYGMFRWTDEAWGVCYQDDVARALIPSMLKALYTGSDSRKQDIDAVLQFLVKTTGTDGMRVFRTDNRDLDAQKLHELKHEPGKLPSAHYNAFYYAMLCLAYRLWGNKDYLDVAKKGMEAILATYPYTTREQSETEELCRLILPLAWLYAETKDEQYKTWLYRVTTHLNQYEHQLGCYLEWDTEYKAVMRHEVGEGECSLLAQNGDPIVDLLYSNNWLPIGFIQAYFVTGDPYFYKKWQSISQFMVTAQLRSEDSRLDGAWARAFDVNKKEVYGSPADFGWGPWAIESGWTVAEITAGLTMGLLADELKTFHTR